MNGSTKTGPKNMIFIYTPKGFFMVQFDNIEDYSSVTNDGPWFWGRAGLFVTSWFPDFDANSMVVTKMIVSVRLHNLPLPFWCLFCTMSS